MNDHQRPVIIEGTNIYFSALHRDDLAQFTRWYSNIEISTYLGRVGSFVTEQDEQAWLDDNLKAKPDLVIFTIIVRETNHIIGTISLMEIDHRHGTATLGISIGESSKRGQGYGSEAVRLMAEYGCFFLNLWNIKLWLIDFNTRGYQAYIKAGFQEVGRVRGAHVIGGERYDSILMDITRNDLDLSQMRAMISLLP